MRKHILRVGMAGLLWVALPGKGLWAGEMPKGSVSVGQAVPDFTVTDSTGKDWKLGDLQKFAGKGEARPAVLIYFCTTCAPCRKEEALIDKFAKEFAGKALVAAISATRGESAQKCADFIQKKGMSFPCLFDNGGKSVPLFAARTTLTIVIDSKGVLRYRGALEQDGREFAKEALVAVLAGKEVAEKETKDCTS